MWREAATVLDACWFTQPTGPLRERWTDCLQKGEAENKIIKGVKGALTSKRVSKKWLAEGGKEESGVQSPSLQSTQRWQNGRVGGCQRYAS